MPLPAAAARDGFVSLQPLHIQTSIEKEGSSAEGPLEREGAVLLLNVASPDLLSREIQTDEFPVAVEEPRPLAFGDRRRIGKSTHPILAHPVGHLHSPPFLSVFAVEIERETSFGRFVYRRHQHVIVPHYGCGTARTGQGRGPNHAIAPAKGGREIFFATRTIEIRPAPLRPILSSSRKKDRKDHAGGQGALCSSINHSIA